MKLAVLSDIHGNHAALEACVEDLQKRGADAVVFLGDYVTDCPCPEKTVALVQELSSQVKTWMIRGNREDYLLAHRQNRADGWCDSSQTGSLLYTYERLSSADLDFFASLPISRIIRPENAPPITVCHGSPECSKESLRPGAPETDRCLSRCETPLLLCGHTHRPCRYGFAGRTLVNCGSVGLQVTGQTCAQYVLLEQRVGGWKDMLISVPYDVGGLVREFEESGLFARAGMWPLAVLRCLQTGTNYPKMLIEQAVRFEQAARFERGERLACRQQSNGAPIPEACWLAAAQALGLDA
jgi:putative phosphoesterase